MCEALHPAFLTNEAAVRAAIVYSRPEILCHILGVDPQAARYAVLAGLKRYDVWSFSGGAYPGRVYRQTLSPEEFEALRAAFEAEEDHGRS